MVLWVNKTQQEYKTPLSLLQLLTKLQKAQQSGIAVAVNNRVIPKNDWPAQSLNDQDSITIITATQGG
ncbi:MAG: sulfur carrier protein ThiS [Aureispira sp.]